MESTLEFDNQELPVITCNTLVIGSGAAGLATADALHRSGVEDVVIATVKLGSGASAESGSDKQTYYKLSQAGMESDKPYDMARSLFDGGSMHGDIALIESALSSRAFYHLVEIGVPFPHNLYGGYTGYKTDHDPCQRAVSAGPRTSHMMVDKFEAQIKKQNTRIDEGVEIIKILTVENEAGNKRAIGAVGIEHKRQMTENSGLVIYYARNVVLACGGPGGLYKTSVYPESQFGSMGLAMEAGAVAQNLTELQFGIASIKFRWNLSGTYQQVIPRYVSTDKDGNDEKEFMNDHFPNIGKLSLAVFLKGYQWPFDSQKIRSNGSSLVDILVHREIHEKGRRVWLDFTRNPVGNEKIGKFDLENLHTEAYEYLRNSDALFGKPIDRLKRMNPPAIQLFRDHNIDISKEKLEIAVCAQHLNGGLRGDIWWQTKVKHLFAVGEVNGTHGVYRPGGSALNSGQVGAIRAAEYITNRSNQPAPAPMDMKEASEAQIVEIARTCHYLMRNLSTEATDTSAEVSALQERMSKAGAHIRENTTLEEALKEAIEQYQKVKNNSQRIEKANQIVHVFRNIHLCLSQCAILWGMADYLKRGGGSRGSALVIDPAGEVFQETLGDEWKFKRENESLKNSVQEIIHIGNGYFKTAWVQKRPVPKDNFWFENVWTDFREGKLYGMEIENEYRGLAEKSKWQPPVSSNTEFYK